MPHSSGGGSHGGGSHSGHSSSSFSRSSGNHDNPVYISHKPSPNAHRYVYYRRYSMEPEYLYADGRVTTPHSILSTIVAVLALTAFFAAFFVMFFNEAYFRPHKLDTTCYNSEIHYIDEIGLAGDAEALIDELEAFRETTGITPAVEFIFNSKWINYYTDLQTYAYSRYLELFDDETHWLVVISYPDDYLSSEFTAWQWEGMIGDDTDKVINEALEDKFTAVIHRHLLRSDNGTMVYELSLAYNEYTSVVMKPQKDIAIFILLGFITLLYLFLVFNIIRNNILERKVYNGTKVRANAREFQCEYCGCRYVEDTVTSCPHCGAAIPAAPTPE